MAITLQQFLNENLVEGLTREVAISDRFKDENGEILNFKIRPITPTEISFIRKNCNPVDKKGNHVFDEERWTRDICILATLEPSFKDAKSIEQTKSVTPENYIQKVMKAGEIARLAAKIQEFSGYKDFNEEVETAKN